MTGRRIENISDLMPVLRARIAELRLTLLEVDHRAGLADGHTGAILRGEKIPSSVTVLRLFAGLDLSLFVDKKSEERTPVL